MNIDEIIKVGIERQASDIHLVRGSKPMLRIQRELIDIPEFEVLTKEEMFEIYEHFINNDVLECGLKKENRLDVNYEVEGTRLRINVSFANGCPIFTIRIIKKELPKFRDLGLPEIVRRISRLPQGLILVTGKSNSGKSTTLNALVDDINALYHKKILTLENPIEYVHESKNSLIVQKEVGEGGDCPTFEIGAINALREDCDILVIGEIRDRETMDAALEVAESGHLVIGTMHTRSCAETIDRMIGFYDYSDQLTIKFIISSVLKAVISQRLLNGKNGNLVMVPEIMIVDDVIAGFIRKEKFSKSEIEDSMQSRSDKGNLGLLNSLANVVINNKISIDEANAQLDDKNQELLARIIQQLKLKSKLY